MNKCFGTPLCPIVTHSFVVTKSFVMCSRVNVSLYFGMQIDAKSCGTALTVHQCYTPLLPDLSAGTVSSGVANTERGHCAKTLAILAHANDAMQHWQWLLLVDDDTLVRYSSAGRLDGRYRGAGGQCMVILAH